MFERIFSRKPGRSHVRNAITTSRDLAEALLGCDLTSASGVAVSPDTAMGVAAVQCAVRVISETIGMLPFPLYERMGEDGKKKARGHAVWKVINGRPNPWMTAQEFRETLTAQMLLYGDGFGLKNRAGGALREIYPLHPNRVRVERKKDFSAAYHVTMADGGTQELGPDRILHIRDLSLDGHRGLSRVRQCRDAIGLSKATELFGSQFFANSGRPGGILTTDQVMGPDAVKAIRESWALANSGDRKMGTAVLDGGFKWISVTQTAEEAQNIETRKFQVTEIARIFRLPPHKIGDLEKASFSNIEQQDLDFYKSSMLPWASRWENAVDTQLLEGTDQEKFYAKLNMTALLRGDSTARSNFYQKMVQAKIMTRNEVRILEDLDPVEGGDVFENPAITPGEGGNQNAGGGAESTASGNPGL